MISLATLALFLLAVLALFLSPGPNMAFVLSHGVAHGPRGGFAAALGISSADLVHTLFAATGVTALVAAWPPSFDLLRYAGALYLLWLAVQALRSSGGLPTGARAQPSAFARIVRMAFLNNLVNPKALLFFMVFLPQFVDPARGSVPCNWCSSASCCRQPRSRSTRCSAPAADSSAAGCSAVRGLKSSSAACWPW